MTTKTDDIKLPPLPPYDRIVHGRKDTSMFWYEGSMHAYARAAVEADRQGRMPSDEEIDRLSHGFALQYQDHVRGFARALLSRYGNSHVGQPAASVIIGFEQIGSAGPFTVIDGRVSVPAITVMDLVRMAQPAASAEPPKLTDDEIERLVIQLGVTWKEDAWKIEDADLHPMVRALLYRYTAAPVAQEPVMHIRKNTSGQIYLTDAYGGPFDISKYVNVAFYAAPVATQPWQDLAAAIYQAAGAYDMPVRILDALSAAANGEPFAHMIAGLLPVESPVAQEPVGEVFTMEPLDGSGDVKSHLLLTKDLPAGTKLYAAPIAAQEQSAVNQQMTTEPNAQDREDAEVTAYALPGGVSVERCMQLNGTYLWAVRDSFKNCLSKSGEWDDEPFPSARTEYWLAQHRFDSADAAIDAARAKGE